MQAKLISFLIFVVMFGFIITDRYPKHRVTLFGAVATMAAVFGICMRDFSAAAETLNIGSMFQRSFWYQTESSIGHTVGVNWATIIFITGMMIMVEGMSRAGFFRWLCMAIAKMVKYRTTPIFVAFMLLSAGMSMFFDSVTVILFLATATLELAHLLKFDPIPIILSEVFCANLGGSASMCGDPPNIIIGTSFGYSFWDFVSNTGVIAAVSLVIVMVYFYVIFRKNLVSAVDPADLSAEQLENEIEYPFSFGASWVVFILTVILLVSHSATGLTVATIGVVTAVLTLIVAGRDCLKLLAAVDYATLLFFVGLFIVVGGLEQSGVLETIAHLIGVVSGGNHHIMIAIIIFFSGIASAFIDNIPFAATMIPVIYSLSMTEGIDLTVLAWALAMGTDIGGNATPIGASANVVGMSAAEKEGYLISWGTYCKALAPLTIIVLILSTAMIWTRYL